jgi:putative ABC transport system ATP-binding protein
MASSPNGGSAEPFIEVTDLHRHFRMGREVVRALNGVSLTVQKGEFLGISGPSGSGKSTLLYLLGGLDRPTSGSIRVQGQEISGLDEDELAEYRREKIGFIFQMFNLMPTLTALENVEFPMFFSTVPPRERQQKSRQLLELVGLGERIDHRPTELSGGQQQRVAIARALVNDPAIILADEPTGNLDSRAGGEVMELLHELNRQGRTVIIVSHDPAVIAQTSRSIHLHDGCIQR